MWKENTFGITEESYQLLEVNAKEIMNDRSYLYNKVLEGSDENEFKHWNCSKKRDRNI